VGGELDSFEGNEEGASIEHAPWSSDALGKRDDSFEANPSFLSPTDIIRKKVSF